MNEESVLKNRESLAPSEREKKNSPILLALSRHVAKWPDSVTNNNQEVQPNYEEI